MEILITILSIFVLAGVAWIIGRVSPLKICPICAGVSGTWIWMLVIMSVGLFPSSDFRLLSAILMGGSIVGVAYQMERRIRGDWQLLLWKILFIPAGFAGVYGFIDGDLTVFLSAAPLLVLLFIIFKKPFAVAIKNKEIIEELKDKMTKCC